MILKTIADFDTQLASPVSVGATTATLVTATDDDGVALPTGTYGLTIDNGSTQKEYIICTLTGTALTSIQSISRQGAVTTGFARSHRRGAKVALTDWASLKKISNLLDGTENFPSSINLGYDGSPTGLTGNQFATVAYVLSVVSGGTVAFDTQILANQTLGETVALNDIVYFKESDQKWYKADADLTTTFDQLQLGVCKVAGNNGGTTQVVISGSTAGFTGLTAGSKYYLSNTAGAITTTAGTYSVFIGWALNTTTLLFNSILKTLPTQKEKDALVGSTGVPSSTNKYVTQDNTSSATTDQSQTTQNGTVEVGEANATTKKNKLAQSFTPTKTKIRGVNLYKSADTGTFTGTVTISLQADTAGSPSGSDLATKTFTNADWLTLPVGMVESLFSSEYASMTTGSLYWLVITTSTSDTSNHPNFGTNTAGGYANGSVKFNNTTDGWTAIATIDLYFSTLEGNNSQAVVTNTSGKIESAFYDVSEMPEFVRSQAYVQDISFGKSTTGSSTNLLQFHGSTCNKTGSVIWIHGQSSASRQIVRLERDGITGQYFPTHAVTPSVATGNSAVISLGSYIYVFYDGGDNVSCYRYLASDLTGETLMTISTPIASTNANCAFAGWSDYSTNMYLVGADTTTTVRKLTVSGTTITQAGTSTAYTTFMGTLSACSFFDGTNVYLARQTTETLNLYKLTLIDGSTGSTTTKIQNSYSQDQYINANILAGIDSTRIYVGLACSSNGSASVDYFGLKLLPISKP